MAHKEAAHEHEELHTSLLHSVTLHGCVRPCDRKIFVGGSYSIEAVVGLSLLHIYGDGTLVETLQLDGPFAAGSLVQETSKQTTAHVFVCATKSALVLLWLPVLREQRAPSPILSGAPKRRQTGSSSSQQRGLSRSQRDNPSQHATPEQSSEFPSCQQPETFYKHETDEKICAVTAACSTAVTVTWLALTANNEVRLYQASASCLLDSSWKDISPRLLCCLQPLSLSQALLDVPLAPLAWTHVVEIAGGRDSEDPLVAACAAYLPLWMNDEGKGSTAVQADDRDLFDDMDSDTTNALHILACREDGLIYRFGTDDGDLGRGVIVGSVDQRVAVVVRIPNAFIFLGTHGKALVLFVAPLLDERASKPSLRFTTAHLPWNIQSACALDDSTMAVLTSNGTVHEVAVGVDDSGAKDKATPSLNARFIVDPGHCPMASHVTQLSSVLKNSSLIMTLEDVVVVSAKWNNKPERDMVMDTSQGNAAKVTSSTLHQLSSTLAKLSEQTRTLAWFNETLDVLLQDAQLALQWHSRLDLFKASVKGACYARVRPYQPGVLTCEVDISVANAAKQDLFASGHWKLSVSMTSDLRPRSSRHSIFELPKLRKGQTFVKSLCIDPDQLPCTVTVDLILDGRAGLSLHNLHRSDQPRLAQLRLLRREFDQLHFCSVAQSDHSFRTTFASPARQTVSNAIARFNARPVLRPHGSMQPAMSLTGGSGLQQQLPRQSHTVKLRTEAARLGIGSATEDVEGDIATSRSAALQRVFKLITEGSCQPGTTTWHPATTRLFVDFPGASSPVGVSVVAGTQPTTVTLSLDGVLSDALAVRACLKRRLQTNDAPERDASHADVPSEEVRMLSEALLSALSLSAPEASGIECMRRAYTWRKRAIRSVPGFGPRLIPSAQGDRDVGSAASSSSQTVGHSAPPQGFGLEEPAKRLLEMYIGLN